MNQASRPLLAAAWMIGAIVSFSSMAIAGRAVISELDTFEMMMYRSFIGLVVILAVGATTRKFDEIRFDNLPLHAIRNLAHFTGQNLWFYALTLITLAQVFALEFTSPIWVMIFASLFLGEVLTRVRLLSVAIAFLGALLVAQPGGGANTIGLSMAAASAIAFAGSIVCTKRLTRTETTFGILFWLTVMQSVFGAVAAGWDGDVSLPSAHNWPWVTLIGFAGLLAHTCLTNALSVAPASIVTPMDFLRLPAIAIVGMAFYEEALDMFVFVGAALIFAGNYLNILSESRSRSKT